MSEKPLAQQLHHAWLLARHKPLAFLLAAGHRAGRVATKRFRGTFSPERAERAFAASYAPPGRASEVWQEGLSRLLPGVCLDRTNYLRRWSARRAEVVAQVEKICQHRFDLLGSGEVELGQKIDWHRDFKSGRRWPLEPSNRLPIFYAEDTSDIKVVWELSRFQQLPTLGKAYWLTREKRYAEEFGRQLADWMERNPAGQGPNWMVAMEAAIRAVNWMYAAHFFLGSASLDEEFWRRLLKSLFLHGWFIRRNLEWNPYGRGNHYLADIVGLLYLGVFFQGSGTGAEWLACAFRELATEMDHQVRDDGVAHEASLAYHRLDAELLLAGCVTAGRALGQAEVGRASLDKLFGAKRVRQLEAMLEFIRHYTRPDGRAPIVGDTDDGRLLQLEAYGRANPADHRHLLATAAVVFEREDFARAAGDQGWEEAWWLTGKSPPPVSEASAKDAEPGSRAFPAGGFFLMRTRGVYALIRCGDVGIEGLGPHAHCDQLSFELAAGTQSLVIDPGSYVYTADLAERHQFRSTASHNTVRVDAVEQNWISAHEPFRTPDDTRARLRHWATEAARDEFEGEHFGYLRLPQRVVHRRRCLLEKSEAVFYVVDHLSGRWEAQLEWFFHLAPGVSAAARELCPRANLRGLKELKPAGSRLASSWALKTPDGFEFPLFILAPMALRGEVGDGWASTRYGVRERISVLRFRVKATLPVAALFVFDLGEQQADLRA